MSANTDSDAIAARFVDARHRAVALSNYPGDVPQSLKAAYLVQDSAITRASARVGGWKVGRIMPPLDAEWGSGRLAGPILDHAIQFAVDANLGAPAVGKIFVGGFGAAEAEFLFRIGEHIRPARQHYSLQDAAALISHAHIGIEIASSPLATINALGPPVIISDFGNNNGLIIGPAIEQWRDLAFADWQVEMAIDGNTVGSGQANAFPDGPLGSVRFLLELMSSRGLPLEAGCWISTGAITGVHDVRVGQRVEAHFHSPSKTASVQCVIAAASN
jgi:2-keto-4-pentenoate hydratase